MNPHYTIGVIFPCQCMLRYVQHKWALVNICSATANHHHTATKQELFAIMRLLWQTEATPPALVRGTFVMLYKKGPRDNFGNYRAIGLMCHSYKLLSMLVLHRMRDAVESRLAETQAGFHRKRGCRDNVLLLRLLMDAVLRAGKQAVVTFIDYRAAFDTISHHFLDESLTAAGVHRRSAA